MFLTAASEHAHTMDTSQLNQDDLMARIQAQVNAQMGEVFREQVTDKCFAVCVTSPSSSLTTRETTCLHRYVHISTDSAETTACAMYIYIYIDTYVLFMLRKQTC